MKFFYDDGGREAAGFKGRADDCVARAVSIASGKPYAEVYDALAEGMGTQRKTKNKRHHKGRSARNGVSTRRKWFKDYMASLGFKWVPTMLIGSGCKVHLHDGELPQGRLVVAVSKHYTAVIDGTVHDTFDPQREIYELRSGPDGYAIATGHVSRRCVYGYWIPIEEALA